MLFKYVHSLHNHKKCCYHLVVGFSVLIFISSCQKEKEPNFIGSILLLELVENSEGEVKLEVETEEIEYSSAHVIHYELLNTLQGQLLKFSRITRQPGPAFAAYMPASCELDIHFDDNSEILMDISLDDKNSLVQLKKEPLFIEILKSGGNIELK